MARELLGSGTKECTAMKVTEMMTRDVRTCFATDSLNRAAQIMWDGDCGCVPVVDEQRKLVGIITDRDVCMAAYTQGRPLAEMNVASAASRDVVVAREDDTLLHAEILMHDAQVRRLPVLDAEGHVVGILSISDLARRARELAGGIPGHIVAALAGISESRSAATDTAAELKKELKKSVELLRSLRDEVRVRLHLGSLDLRDQWKKLEPHLGEVEKKAEELTETSRAAITDALKRLEHFRTSLSEHH
jgi:CBS domain-containing protein